jgi:hypothetical protein
VTAEPEDTAGPGEGTGEVPAARAEVLAGREAELADHEESKKWQAPVYRHGMTKGAFLATRRLSWALGLAFAVTVLAALANLYVTVSRTTATCSFYRDLSGLPVTIVTGTGRPSELSVTIIAHSRSAYRGLGCPGGLPPPSPSFAHWAPYYHQDPH